MYKICEKCGSLEGYADICPFDEEMSFDNEKLYDCDCCFECRGDCTMEI